MEALSFPWEEERREVAPSAFRPRKNRPTSARSQASKPLSRKPLRMRRR